MITPDDNNTIFQLAEDFVNQTTEHLFLTGKAGTGKTTFLRHIRETTHKKVVVAAPTGVAAINAGGVTLHSLFQLPFEPYIPGYSIASLKKNFFRFSKQKIDLLKQLELLIIDEVSMLRADTLDAIDSTLRIIRRNSRPFAGVQVLYIGDLFQLPPVAKEEEWTLLKDYYRSTFFFEAKVIEATQPVYLELKKVYRQGDPKFVDLLNRIRNNQVTPEDYAVLNRLHEPTFTPPEEDKYIILTTHNYRADRINNGKLQELSSSLTTFHGEIKDEFPDYSLPTELDLHLKEGAQVMFLKNDQEEPRRFYNGKIATVSRIDEGQIYVHIPETGEEILMKKETWENKRFLIDKQSGEIVEEILGSFTQYPLRLAWAITIHKSQGLTFEKAIIDVGASFAAGQTYVALSRCTSLEGIKLYSRLSPRAVMTDELALNFSKNEKQEQELQAIFRQGRRKFWTERLLLYFDWKEMHHLLRTFEKLLADKEGDEYLAAHKLLQSFKEKIRSLEEVSLRFQQQLRSIIQAQTSDDDLDLLRERCCKAVTYFHKEAINDLLLPLQEYISDFKPTKKSRTYLKNITLIEEDIILFLEDFKRIRYNNIPLVEDLKFSIPRRKDLFR